MPTYRDKIDWMSVIIFVTVALGFRDCCHFVRVIDNFFNSTFALYRRMELSWLVAHILECNSISSENTVSSQIRQSTWSGTLVSSMPRELSDSPLSKEALEIALGIEDGPLSEIDPSAVENSFETEESLEIPDSLDSCASLLKADLSPRRKLTKMGSRFCWTTISQTR